MYMDEVLKVKSSIERKMSKEDKEQRVLEFLQPRCPNDQWAAYTRPQIARMTGIKRTTAHNILDRLVGQGKVERKEMPGHGPGRPTVFYRLPV